MASIEQNTDSAPSAEIQPPESGSTADPIAEQLRAATTIDEKAAILAPCIGKAVGKFSSLNLSEIDLKNNPIYRQIRARLGD